MNFILLLNIDIRFHLVKHKLEFCAIQRRTRNHLLNYNVDFVTFKYLLFYLDELQAILHKLQFKKQDKIYVLGAFTEGGNMRTQCTLWLFVSVVLLIGAAIALGSQKMKILIITGGHDFERDQFFAMFDSMSDIEFTSVEHPGANDIYATSSLQTYDALVYYDMNQEISEEQKRAFLTMVEKGKGLVFLHHSLASYQTWDEYKQIQGGRYNENPEDAAKKSTYKHDVTMNVYILDRDHPVTQGLSDFEIYDEVYGNFEVSADVHPLLKTDHPQSGEIIGWAHAHGASKIVYLQPGHDHHAYENENYRALVRRAIRWVAE